jgi:hypothetical protein
VDRPELRVEAALAHARQILVTLGVALVEAPAGILEPGGRVGVGIDHDGVAVQPLRGVLCCGRGAPSEDQQREREGTHTSLLRLPD